MDIHFLNRGSFKNVQSFEQIQYTFCELPTDTCLTPLSSKVSQILEQNFKRFQKGNLVLIVATDGEPKSADGTDSIHAFSRLLRQRHHVVNAVSVKSLPVSFRLCTNDLYSIRYLNTLDNDESLYIDVTDDYRSELEQISYFLGPKFQFSYGDYILKSLMGSFDPWMDKIDEPCKFTMNEIRYQIYGELPPKKHLAKRRASAKRESCIIA